MPRRCKNPPFPYRPRLALAVRVGELLRAHRWRRGMTLKHVAEKSGVGVTHIGRIERGDANPTLFALEVIAATTGWDIGEGLSASLSDPTAERADGAFHEHDADEADWASITGIVEEVISFLERLRMVLPPDAINADMPAERSFTEGFPL